MKRWWSALLLAIVTVSRVSAQQDATALIREVADVLKNSTSSHVESVTDSELNASLHRSWSRTREVLIRQIVSHDGRPQVRFEAMEGRRIPGGLPGRETRDQDVVLLGVNDDETPEQALKFANEQGYGWSSLFDGRQKDARTKFKVSAIPALVLIDREGIIADYQIGSGEDAEASIRSGLKKLGVTLR